MDLFKKHRQYWQLRKSIAPLKIKWNKIMYVPYRKSCLYEKYKR